MRWVGPAGQTNTHNEANGQATPQNTGKPMSGISAVKGLMADPQ
jgi:hypothetical protein